MKSKFILMMCAATLLSTGAVLAEPMADRAVKQLEGNWVTTDGSRTIEFAIKNNSALFSDTVRPGITVTGGYGQGERGAAYQLDYPERLTCSYNVAFPSQEKGNEMIMTLVAAVPKEQAHRCIVGTLKRAR